MKTIEDRTKEWVRKNLFASGGAAERMLKSALTELAADLNAEKEKEVAELKTAIQELSNSKVWGDQRCAKYIGEIAKLQAWKESALKVMPDFLDEVKRVLAIAQPDVCYMCCPAKPTDGRDWVHEEECESVRQLLTRLGGSHE